MGSRRVFRNGPGTPGTLAYIHGLGLLLFATFAMLAAGCGFQLQGASALPEGTSRVFIATSDELTPFAVELRRAIERAGGTIATGSVEADTVVRVQRDRGGRRVLSVSARNTPQEFEIFYNVEFTIDRGGRQVVELQRLELVRNLSFDESQLLAKDREEAILRDAMARDLAMLVVRRLESLPPAPPAASTPSPAQGESR